MLRNSSRPGNHYFLDQRTHSSSCQLDIIYLAAPDIASDLAARGFSQWEGNSIVLIVTPLLATIESQVEELNLKNGIKAVNLGNGSDVKLESHVRNGSYNFFFGGGDA